MATHSKTTATVVTDKHWIENDLFKASFNVVNGEPKEIKISPRTIDRHSIGNELLVSPEELVDLLDLVQSLVDSPAITNSKPD
jgi:hypothetical protein